MWWCIMPEIMLGILRMWIYFSPLQNDCCCTEYYSKVLCNFWSVGEVFVFLYVCSFVYLGQLLYFLLGKLWEVDSFGCFAQWCWAGYQKAQSSLRWEATSFILQGFFFLSLPLVDNIVEKNTIHSPTTSVCNLSLSYQPGGLNIKEDRQGVWEHG